MRHCNIGSSALLWLLFLLGRAQAFVAPSQRRTTNSALAVQLPRVDLPAPITEKMQEFGLQNPNKMNPSEYQGYGGAAILGTLLFFAVPGALLTGILDEGGALLSAIILNFVVSALVGGGLAIYLSLTKEEIGTSVRDLSATILAKGKELTGWETLRYDLPDAAVDLLTVKLGLLNPNDMDEKDYDGYAGAAVMGTLAFFLLPGSALTGTPKAFGDFLSTVLTDFVLSAIIGGGLFIFLSLRNDDISVSVNDGGIKLLDAFDGVLGLDKALPKAKDVPEAKPAPSSSPVVSKPEVYKPEDDPDM